MSKYTTQIRWIVEQFADDDTLSIREKIDKSLPIIFNFNYPIWSESYRTELERKIIKHYFNKEIGLETYALWQLYLDERLNLIMPYYNELYTTITKKYDWLEDVNLIEKTENNKTSSENVLNNNDIDSTVTDNEINTTNQNSKNTNKIDRTSKNLNSDFPQANFQDLDYGTNLIDSEGKENSEDNQTNTINANINKSNTSKTQANEKRQANREEQDLYSKTIIGLNGSRSKTSLNLEYRQSLINIDKMIIDELKDLFMLIY